MTRVAAAVVAAVIAVTAPAAWMLRYQMIAAPDAGATRSVYVLDRFTGDVYLILGAQRRQVVDVGRLPPDQPAGMFDDLTSRDK